MRLELENQALRDAIGLGVLILLIGVVQIGGALFGA